MSRQNRFDSPSTTRIMFGVKSYSFHRTRNWRQLLLLLLLLLFVSVNEFSKLYSKIGHSGNCSLSLDCETVRSCFRQVSTSLYVL